MTHRPRDRYGRPLPAGSPDELGHAERPGHAVASTAEAIRRGITLFDEQRFFEAHECFELVWKHGRIEPGDRDFWKGVTQIAVGCCHVQRGNAGGAVALLARAVEKLGGYPSPHRGVNTEGLGELARTVAARVRRRGASADLDFPRFPGSSA